MEISKEKFKQIITLMIIAAILVLCIIYCDSILNALGLAFGITMPFIAGGAVAFVLNIPLNLIEKKLFKNWMGKSAKRLKRPASIVCTLLFVALLVTILIVTVVPQIGKTISDIAGQVPVFVDRIMILAGDLQAKYLVFDTQTDILAQLEKNWDNIVNGVVGFMKNGFGNVLNSTIGIASGIVSKVTSGFIAFIFSIYVLAQKERLGNQIKRVFNAFLSEKANRRVFHVIAVLNKNFTNFITGQCLEACILGSMFVVSMLILRMPYAVMIGVLIAFTALIPIVGAFIGCIVGAFLILMVSPVKAVGFVVLFLVLQQIEGNLIYPKVVGSSVGLPAIWVLVAVTVGGSMFGIIGMLAFIPLVSTIYTLLRDEVNRRNEKKRTASVKEVKKNKDNE